VSPSPGPLGRGTAARRVCYTPLHRAYNVRGSMCGGRRSEMRIFPLEPNRADAARVSADGPSPYSARERTNEARRKHIIVLANGPLRSDPGELSQVPTVPC